MFLLGLLLLVLGLFGVARGLFLPLGVLLLCVGLIWDVLHFVGHTAALIF